MAAGWLNQIQPDFHPGIYISNITHNHAKTEFFAAAGIKFAYRRLGKAGGVPLVMFRHFTGNLDNWDPPVIDGLAKDREVILFNNRGIASTEGEVPTTYADMAKDAAAFIDALHLKSV
jgi:pimeloyl-ACP methyl ester carboxylesterase